MRKTELQIMESMKKDLLTIKLKLDNPTSTQPLENYADKVKTNRNETQTKCTTDIRSGTRQNRDPRNILLIKTNQKFRDSIEIKRAFASNYPNKKLLYAFITARDSIHLEFTTPEEADCVLEGWWAEFFGGDSSARTASDRNEQHSAVIRGVRLEVSDSELTSALTENFPGVRIRCFVKSDEKTLQTVKLTFPSKAQFDKARTDGIFIDHLYYQPVEFIHQGIRIFRCYRCQKFGHVSSNCHSKVSCKHCSGEHSIDNCSGNQPARCTNCSGSHEADSLDCPFYIKQVQRVHEARGLQAPTLRNPVSKNDG